MIDFILTGVLALIVGTAAFLLHKSKKKGCACSSCVYAKNCIKKSCGNKNGAYGCP